jgi:hypothetical protein
MISFLGREDIDSVINIARLKSRHSGGGTTAVAALEELFESSFSNPNKLKMVGFFENEALVSWACFKYGELDDNKTWAIVHLFTSKFNNILSWNKPELGLLIKTGFDLAESTGHFDYIYSISTKLENVYDRQWAKNRFLPPRNRYIRSKIAEIQANLIPSINWQARLINAPQAVNVSILKRTLKEEFRNDFSASNQPS